MALDSIEKLLQVVSEERSQREKLQLKLKKYSRIIKQLRTEQQNQEQQAHHHAHAYPRSGYEIPSLIHAIPPASSAAAAFRTPRSAIQTT